MSQIQFGLPLEQPSKQTILPYITDSGRVYGFFAITETTFDGTETTFTVAPGTTVTVKTVTLPPINANNVDSMRVTQYMAAYFPIAQEGQRPWTAYSTLVRTDMPNRLGYYNWWSMPVMTVINHFGRGTYLNALKFGLDPNIGTSTPTPPPVTTPQTLTWATSIDPLDLSKNCSFFDFSWVDLFKSAPAFNPDVAGNTVVPISINVVSNPPGGVFKAVQVQNSGQTIYPGGGVSFDTIRILKLDDAAPGTYTFNFTIQYNASSSATSPSMVPAVLNLTVV
jgi:hypothetical protein